ncbi:NADPH-dependent F420 reductase [uncultured Methanoregula sp.]|uniref:NADPH-dependent F420 reductase n=1 Tax=uncultured Methanoregula sp. TaxID=1005933 RepID=UPI002AAB1ED4|nr:NADPH-dependent F420 reductase [uncultured Methanoregula sp.]
MKIGIVGGTGDIGEGIALRLSPLFDVVVGSREKEKAQECCTLGSETLRKRGLACSLTGVSNQQAVDEADIVILAIPYKHLVGTLQTLNGFENKIVISPVNPMEKRDFFTTVPPVEGSAALLIKKMISPQAKICTAFNAIAANRWKALDEELTYSVPVCGDDAGAKHTVMEMVNRISHLTSFDAGPLAASGMVESLTPLLLNIARYNKIRDVGIQFR